MLDRFAAAFENGDAQALAGLLRDDAVLEMPPFLTWFAGRETVREFFATRIITAPGLFRMVPVAANGQQAFAAYQRAEDEDHDDEGVYRADAIAVPTLTANGIARIVTFLDPRLFTTFGLPAEITAA